MNELTPADRDWTENAGSADWEPSVTPPAGMRTATHSELSALRQQAERRFPAQKRVGLSLIQSRKRRVFSEFMRLIREAGIFVEGST